MQIIIEKKDKRR